MYTVNWAYGDRSEECATWERVLELVGIRLLNNPKDASLSVHTDDYDVGDKGVYTGLTEDETLELEALGVV